MLLTGHLEVFTVTVSDPADLRDLAIKRAFAGGGQGEIYLMVTFGACGKLFGLL